ncbi:DUF4174 domain-containing protein [Rubellimicrobium aerolatum]|uniref:DUF4174 domain-containing protein n=1 Tax=Rubellimicrobium aerolatum TaxID=490979 RepID=A0ABW0S910_9RHOB|nr:DUF4174 domain-containing protein [Rubellimicrobium aerolatum]MBP1804791.1 hypothetical protein [Rubellimicrobium aerolatum]
MTHALALAALLLATPAWAQEAAPAAPPIASASEAAPVDVPADDPADPVAAWEADRTAVLDAGAVDLSAFEYVARPLVIFADSPRQPQVEEQLRLLAADPEALARRDVVVILDTDPEARSPARQSLRPRGFGLVLVDKDGRVTLRRPAPLSVREIGRAIDRTPLRQEEVRNGRGSDLE